MKLLSWNVNHRTQRKPIPTLIPEAIQALAPDLLVLTEYVRGRRINTRKRVRLLLAFFEDRVPPLFRDLRDEAIRKDRHLSIELGRLIIRENNGLKMTPFLSDSIERVRVTG